MVVIIFEPGRGSDNIGAGKQTTAIIAPNVTLGNNTRKRTNNANHWTTCLRGDDDDGADDGGHDVYDVCNDYDYGAGCSFPKSLEKA